MENEKQKAIEVAYGIYYLEGNSIDENGWTDSVSPRMLNTIPCDYKSMEIEYKRTSHFYRPKSLSGIETNNNWISIHSEYCHLIEDEFYFVVIDGNISIKQYHLIQYKFWNECVSHYQPIIKPKKPIY